MYLPNRNFANQYATVPPVCRRVPAHCDNLLSGAPCYEGEVDERYVKHGYVASVRGDCCSASAVLGFLFINPTDRPCSLF